ncbi:MAG: hypothetical protein JWL60_1209 [Gemmatimonadetes bacterium]|jgi:tetratricopeptide (TPR) repeat protein|nr:hypothetical protein [Gemmatimonadota bacterium]
MASSARIDEIKKKFDENPRRYFAPLANEFRKAGDLEQAIIICEEFLPQQAGHMSGHIVYGQALYESGRLPESRTVFETALGLDPENLIALRHLGDIARSQGEMAAARQWYDRVLEADPRNEEIQTLIAGLGDGAGTATAATDAPPAASADLLSIELDMDAELGLPQAPSPAPASGAPTPPARESAPFDAITLDGLQSGNAEAATAAAMPDPRSARAEGLEPSEFEAPTGRLERAPDLEPAEFEAPTSAPARAEGLESTAFSAPSSSSVDDSLLDLEASFGMGTSAPSPSSAPHDGASTSSFRLDGLEPTGATQPPPREGTALPSLDPVDAPGGTSSTDDPMLLDTEVPSGVENPRMEPPAAMEAMPALEMEPAAPRLADGLPMMELTPAVIDAESKLMDAGLSYEGAPGDSRDDTVPVGQPPFVTETMAELYLQQGFREQALDVYRQLAKASPSDARLAARLAELQQADAGQGAAAAGSTVRDFFFRLATRRPGERGADAAAPARDDFAAFDATADRAPTPEPAVAGPPMHDDVAGEPGPAAPAPAAVAPSSWDFVPTPQPKVAQVEGSVPAAAAPDVAAGFAPEPTAEALPAPGTEPSAPAEPEPVPSPMPSAAERAVTAQGGAAVAGGTIDALFGTRAATRSEDSAASALAQAFGGMGDVPVISGNPARAATKELSLDSVFRDGPARAQRASQSFSFDQFFSENAASGEAPPGRVPDATPTGEPAERSADDIQQFNSWLQGLKQR